MENTPDHAEMEVLVGIPHPLRLVAREGGDSWNVTLDNVNRNDYDWVKLNRVSGGFDGNISPFAMLVCFDGCLVIPALSEFKNKQLAVGIFNRVLAQLLLGGEYTEALMAADVCQGVILPTGYVRISAPSGSAGSRVHTALRSGEASSLESIVLLNTQPMPIADFETAVSRGRDILSDVPKLSPELFLSGITHCVREQWSEGLVAAWTSTEQLISHLWEENVRASASETSIPGRKDFLSDYRTWPASTRVEVLFQRGIVNEPLYQKLNLARKARNAFIHDGSAPGPDSACTAIHALFDLLACCSKKTTSQTDVNNAKVMVLRKFTPRAPPTRDGKLDESQFVAWRHIRHLPGEKGWKGKFERFDLGFNPIEEIRPNDIHKKPRKK